MTKLKFLKSKVNFNEPEVESLEDDVHLYIVDILQRFC